MQCVTALSKLKRSEVPALTSDGIVQLEEVQQSSSSTLANEDSR